MFTMGSAAGLQILPDKLILVNLKKGLQDFSVKQSAVLENFRETSIADLRTRLRQQLQNGSISRENLVLGLPAEEVTLRLVELPIDVEENLAQVVRFQVEKFEPSEEERSYYDYVIVSRDEEQKKILLQIAMVRKGVLDDYLELLRQLNLYPVSARLSSLGLHQVLSLHKHGFPKKEPVVVLNVNPGTIEMVVVVSSARFYSEKLAVDTQALQADKVVLELYEFISRLRLKTDAISRIYTTGALGPELLALLRERFSDCEDLAEKLNLKEKQVVGRNPALIPAIGLAVSRFSKAPVMRLNLIPKEKRIVGSKASLVPTIILLVLLLVIGLTAATRDYQQSNSLAAELDTHMKKLQPEVNRVQAMRRQVEVKQKELDEIRDLMKGEQQVLSVLKELTEKLPDDTYLQTLNIERGQVVLFGFTGSAGTLIPSLKASNRFKSVSSKYTTKDPVTKKDKFNIEAVINEQ